MGVAVEVERLSFEYENGGHLVDVSLTVQQGQVCCLIGPNGAGKTTFLRCLLGLLVAQTGTIRLAGRPIGALSDRERAQQVAYVPQHSSTPFAFSTLDIAVTGRTPRLGALAAPSTADRRAAHAVLDELGIGALADRPFSVLSGGERRLALMARAMVQDAPVLVLDEPMAALDFGNETRVLHVVSEWARSGRSVIMTTHQPWHALACADHALLLRNGCVFDDGPPEEVVTTERLSELYEVRVRVFATVDAVTGHKIYGCAPAINTKNQASTGDCIES
jgi:iron complex transport system ATP-binding protein